MVNLNEICQRIPVLVLKSGRSERTLYVKAYIRFGAYLAKYYPERKYFPTNTADGGRRGVEGN
jgi:hypothetical protein